MGQKFEKSGKRFQASGMRAIDSPQNFSLENMFFRKKIENLDFSIFFIIEAKKRQSIFRLEITLKSRFLQENRKKNFFEKIHVQCGR